MTEIESPCSLHVLLFDAEDRAEQHPGMQFAARRLGRTEPVCSGAGVYTIEPHRVELEKTFPTVDAGMIDSPKPPGDGGASAVG